MGLTACSGVKQEKSLKKEATTEQPTEVSGGFGLTMQCSVLNREVEGATSSEIGCVVSNDDGTKYTGSMKNLKASITGKGQTSAIQATPILTDASSSISVGVSVPGLKPGDALSIAINGLFDEKPATLSSTLKGRFAVICDEDMNLYVQVNAPASNLACTREAPCAKISQAVALLPDVFNCKVNVYLAPSIDGQKTFFDQIVIQGKQSKPGSMLSFIGTDKDFVGDVKTLEDPLDVAKNTGPLDRATKLPPRVILEPARDLPSQDDPLKSGAQRLLRRAIDVRSFGNQSAIVTFANIEINGKSKYKATTSGYHDGFFEEGVLIETSRALISNLSIRNISNEAIHITNSSEAQLSDIQIKNSQSGISAEYSSCYIKNGIFIDADQVAPMNNLVPLAEQDVNLMKPQYGITLNYANLRVLYGTYLKVNDLVYAINLDNSSTISMSKIVWVELKNNEVGISVNRNSTFNWTAELLKTDLSEPYLSITDCQKYCIVTANSSLSLTAAKDAEKPKLLKLESKTDANILIYATDNSILSLDHIQNSWCNAGGLPIMVTNNARFDYKRKSSKEEAFLTCANTNGSIFHNYENKFQPTNGSCEPGTFLKDNACHDRIGYGYIFTDNADAQLPPVFESIGTDADISHW
jgi:hypothetical protein